MSDPLSLYWSRPGDFNNVWKSICDFWEGLRIWKLGLIRPWSVLCWHYRVCVRPAISHNCFRLSSDCPCLWALLQSVQLGQMFMLSPLDALCSYHFPFISMLKEISSLFQVVSCVSRTPFPWRLNILSVLAPRFSFLYILPTPSDLWLFCPALPSFFLSPQMLEAG